MVGPARMALPAGFATARRRRLNRPVAISSPPPNPEDGLLERLLGTHVSPQMLGLWLIEVTLCAALFCVLLSGGGEAESWQAWLRTLDRAVALALTFGLTSAAVGLYSPDTYLRTRGLLINTAVGALLAWPAIWLVGRLFGINIAHPPLSAPLSAPLATPLAAGAALPAFKALLGWIGLLSALRLGFSYALRARLFTRRVLVIGDDDAASRIAAAIAAEAAGFFEVAGVLPPAEAGLPTPRQLRRDRIGAVILTEAARAVLPPDRLAGLAAACGCIATPSSGNGGCGAST